MARDDTDRSAVIPALAAAVGLDLLRACEALSYVLLCYSRARGAANAREGLDDVRSIVAELIERLAPIAFAASLDDARAILEALDDDQRLDDAAPPRRTRH